MKIIYVFLFSLISFFNMVAYTQAAVVGRVVVEGNKRIDTGTILKKAHIKLGRDYSGVDKDEVVKILMATGNFADVSLDQEGNKLIIKVKEYDRVNQIFFHGNKKVKQEDLARVISLQPRDSYEKSKMEADARTIEQAYKTIGLNNVTVTTQAEDLGEGRVNVYFTVNEGKKAKIYRINFVGNKAFSASRLRDVLITKQSNLLSWFTQSDVYSPDRLAADEEMLKRFYKARGFADFRILSTQKNWDENKNGYIITFIVDEGALYRFGAMEIENSVAGLDEAYLLKSLATKPGAIYNARKIDESIIRLNDIVGNSGYAFAKIDAHTNRDFRNHTISLTYSIDKGARIYIERISIKGNDKTRDYVIRREFDLTEGDAFNQTLLQRAKNRLDSLGFFQSVNISTSPGSAPDKIVLNVDVVEQNTGQFSISGGYTTGGATPGFSAEAAISEQNFLGRGQYVSINIGAGQDNARNYNLSFTEPYFLGHDISAGFDVFNSTYRMNDEYDVGQTGGVGRLGFSITNNLMMTLNYNFIREHYGLGGSQDDYAQAIIEASKKPRNRSSVQYGLLYNSLDNMISPHDGAYINATEEYAGLGGDAHFLKTTARALFYKTLSEQHDFVGLLSFSGGYLKQTKPNGVLIFDMFKNDNNTVRGFRYNGFGPRQKAKNGTYYFLGGTKSLTASAELLFPLPIIPDSLGIRGALFADAGTIFDNSYKPKTGENPIIDNDMFFRTSAGASIMWASPLGPLRFDYAFPLRKKEGDIIQKFIFGVSTKF